MTFYFCTTIPSLQKCKFTRENGWLIITMRECIWVRGRGTYAMKGMWCSELDHTHSDVLLYCNYCFQRIQQKQTAMSHYAPNWVCKNTQVTFFLTYAGRKFNIIHCLHLWPTVVETVSTATVNRRIAKQLLLAFH